MRWRPIVSAVVIAVLVTAAIPPVHADIINSLIETAWFAPVPVSRMTVQDHIKEGDSYRKSCQLYTNAEVDRTRKLIEAATKKPVNEQQIRNATNRYYLQGTWQIREDQELQNLRNEARFYCDRAEKSYSMALQKSKDDDFTGQAEIWDHSAELFRAEGISWAQEKSETNADKARTRAAVGSLFNLLPVSLWVIIAALLAGIVAIRYRK
jgi:hypothetical protein